MASNEIETLDPSAEVEKMKKIAADRATDRRYFLAALGMTGAVAGAALMSGCSTSNTATAAGAAAAASAAEINVLNFALNLEFLEATFYSFITQGTDLPANLTAGGGAITGAPAAKLTITGSNAAQITDLLNEIYFDEVNHVAALRSLLGSSAVFRPAINLAAFGTLSASNVLSIARLLEDVGVTAYTGAATSLNNSSLTFSGQILGAESFHAGALRLISLQNAAIAPYVQADTLDVPPFDPGTVALASAGPTAKGGFYATAGGSVSSGIAPSGMAFQRTTSQVLAILYGTMATGGTSVTLAAAGTSSGGFFPKGVNGSINTI